MIILLEGAAATGYIIGICLWYVLVAMFWIAVFIVWGIFALFAAIFNLIRRRRPAEDRWRPQPHVPRPKRPRRANASLRGEVLEVPAPPLEDHPAAPGRCAHCGANMRGRWRFCDACGADDEAPQPALASMLHGGVQPRAGTGASTSSFCTECGSRIPAGGTFCDVCGNHS